MISQEFIILAMVYTYLRTIFRILYRNRTYSLINIAGLSLGLSVCLSLFLIVRTELSYDTFHSKRDKIFRIVSVENLPSGTRYDPGTYYPTAKALRNDFPELENVVVAKQIEETLVTIEHPSGIRKFTEKRTLGFTESSFFQIFDFPLIAGVQEEILERPNVVVLSESLANKYFPAQDPIGKTIRCDNQLDLEVVGVMKDLPPNTVFPFQMVASFQSLEGFDPLYSADNWNARLTDVQVYVQMPAQMIPEQFDNRLIDFVLKYLDDSRQDELRYQVQPLKEVHFDPRFGDFDGQAVSKEV